MSVAVGSGRRKTISKDCQYICPEPVTLKAVALSIIFGVPGNNHVTAPLPN